MISCQIDAISPVGNMKFTIIFLSKLIASENDMLDRIVFVARALFEDRN